MDPVSKPAWQSKTIWVAILVALSPLIPGADKVLGPNGSFVEPMLAALFMVLRLVSKDKISIT